MRGAGPRCDLGKAKFKVWSPSSSASISPCCSERRTGKSDGVGRLSTIRRILFSLRTLCQAQLITEVNGTLWHAALSWPMATATSGRQTRGRQTRGRQKRSIAYGCVLPGSVTAPRWAVTAGQCVLMPLDTDLLLRLRKLDNVGKVLRHNGRFLIRIQWLCHEMGVCCGVTWNVKRHVVGPGMAGRCGRGRIGVAGSAGWPIEYCHWRYGSCGRCPRLRRRTCNCSSINDWPHRQPAIKPCRRESSTARCCNASGRIISSPTSGPVNPASVASSLLALTKLSNVDLAVALLVDFWLPGVGGSDIGRSRYSGRGCCAQIWEAERTARCGRSAVPEFSAPRPNAVKLSRCGEAFEFDRWRAGVGDGYVAGAFDPVGVVAGAFDDAGAGPHPAFGVEPFQHLGEDCGGGRG